MSPSRFNQTGPKIGLSVRLAETQAEIEAAQRLRYQVLPKNWGRKSKAMTAAMSILMMSIAITCSPSMMQLAKLSAATA